MAKICSILLVLVGVLGLAIAAFKHVHIEVIKKNKNNKAKEIEYIKKNILYRHVKVIEDYAILEDKEQIEDILNMVFYMKYKGIVITHRVPREMIEKAIRASGSEVDLDNIKTDEELLALVPPIFCADADVIALTVGNFALYTTQAYNEYINLDKGDKYCDFFK